MTESFEDIRRDQEADKLGNYTLADARLGVDSITRATSGRRLPGKPIAPRRRGSVRDSNDGGRADEYRGGIQATRELSLDEQARNAKGAALAREVLSKVKAQQAPPTDEEIAEKQKADAAELRRKTAESWGDSI